MPIDVVYDLHMRIVVVGDKDCSCPDLAARILAVPTDGRVPAAIRRISFHRSTLKS
jgi:hypothetical protein